MKIKEIIDLYIKKIPKDDIYLLISSFLNCKKLDIIKYYDLDIENLGPDQPGNVFVDNEETQKADTEEK